MNTVYSQEEIIESLKVIKKTCQKAGSCKECPLCIPNSDTQCYVTQGVTPEE